MQEQLGKEATEDRCPPGIEDFPELVIHAISIFNFLGDRVYPDIGYVGKDYTTLPILITIYTIDNVDLLLEILSRLDRHAIEKNRDQLKREHDKLKRKNRG